MRTRAIVHAAAKLSAVLAVSAVPVLVAPAAASAQDVAPMAITCDPIGVTWFSWKNKVSSTVLTHSSAWDNITNITQSGALQTQTATAVTSTITNTVGTGVSAKGVIASMEINYSLQLQDAGTSTTTETVTANVSVPPHSTVVAYGGTIRYTADYEHFKCPSGVAVRDQYGKGISWDTIRRGWVDCSISTSNTLANLAKAKEC
ncbi:hypothetical protein AB0B66_08355 [Catellatospora sp. NPDC049111]|uniref:Uncharacterized protein n=1 Tax=Catellatospora aurea TaxID=1337874 RepID=A0ABW2H8G5_9ACTN